MLGREIVKIDDVIMDGVEVKGRKAKKFSRIVVAPTLNDRVHEHYREIFLLILHRKS